MTSLNRDLDYYGGERLEILRYVDDSIRVVLDVGCGQGRFGEQLIKRIKEVWGVEPNSQAASLAKEILTYVYENKIEEIIEIIPGNYFDLIVLNDVLEHLVDPWQVLKQLKSKLKINGKIMASIPNFRYVTNLYKLLIKRDIEYTSSGILDSTHLRFFTKKSIIRLFSLNNYYIEEIDGLGITKSFFGFLLAILINVFTFFLHRDIFYKQFVIVAS